MVVDGVKKHDRIDALQWPLLPRLWLAGSV